ncbi:MAG: hypothetical protein WDM78_06885 [Puia sp.]
MNDQLVFSDYLIFTLYLILVGSYGYWVYHKRKNKEHDSKGFFLAEGSLTWWAIGASLIASNISAEQFIGMSGNGFFVGVAVSAYEWIAALSTHNHCCLVYPDISEKQDIYHAAVPENAVQ